MALKSSVKSDDLKPEMGLVSKHRRKKTVRWGDLIVYEFPNILGDNPAVSDAGAPLTIAWTHESVNVFTVDYNEFLRQKRPRRRRKDLVISGAQRDTYLLGLGYPLEQLVKAAEEIHKIQRSRQAQIKSLKTWNKFKQVVEGATRGLRFGGSQEPKILAAKSG